MNKQLILPLLLDTSEFWGGQDGDPKSYGDGYGYGHGYGYG